MNLGKPGKPGDHPDFFRFPAPEGRSRESTLRLDAEGRFWHEGRLVEHERLLAALHGWIARHPDDGRYILTNGYDWTYFTVDDAPFFVRALRVAGEGNDRRVVLRLDDATEEEWDPERTRTGPDGALYAPVKRSAPGGPFEAKFSRHAQTSLGPLLVEGPDGDDRPGAFAPAVKIGSDVHVIGAKCSRFG
jgi:hypothetical protein